MHRLTSISILCALALLALISMPVLAQDGLVPARLVAKTGDPLGPSFISGVESPFTDGQGRVGFVGSLSDNQRFIWYDTGAVFFSGDALPDVVTGGESTMGVSDTGGFIYSPSFNGRDAVYTHGGKLLADEDVFPPIPELYSSFNSRPSMLPNGTAYWVCGTSTTPGGSSSNRHLVKATDATDSTTIVRVLGGGDIIEGKMIKTTASNFTYSISDNDEHHIHVLDMEDPLIKHVYLDGGFVAQEGTPTGDGDNWDNFDIVSVNNDGNYIFTGDTDGDTASDEFVAYNGVISIREGDTLDGVNLALGYALRAASINNDGVVAHIWGSGTDEFLFTAPGSNLAASQLVLATGDSIDVDDDMVYDYVVLDFSASTTIGPGLDLAEDGWVYVTVDLEPVGGGEYEAVIGVQVETGTGVADAGAAGLRLLTVEPNPVRDGAWIRCALDGAASLDLSVYDALGRRVRTLAGGRAVSGPQEVQWDGRGEDGRILPAGVYFVRMEAGRNTASERVVLVR